MRMNELKPYLPPPRRPFFREPEHIIPFLEGVIGGGVLFWLLVAVQRWMA